MATVTTDHYRAYTPRPFMRQERDTVTILFGGLHWRAERILQAVLEGAGYRARILPMATKDDLLTGREVADIGQCCPTSFTTGNLVNFLKGEASRIGVEELNKRYVYLTAGACGACRFGQYHQSYELALRNSGLGAFRMFLMAQDQLDQKAAMGDGLDLNLPLTLGLLWGIFVTDLVQDLEYQVRPYEVVPGATDAVARESIEYLFQVFRDRPKRSAYRSLVWHLTTGYFTRALREVHRKFSTIEVDRLRVKPTVKITGEFYLQTVEGEPNYNIHRWLETEGAEGDMLVGKALWAHHKKKAHMICELSPYSCMPNTMSIGAMAGVVGKYPDLLYAPLEIKGDAEVHALSRCQMILTEAKKRAQREFDEALQSTRLTVDEVRAYVDAHPAMKTATYHVPHDGRAAGTAAKMVLHVAEKMGRR